MTAVYTEKDVKQFIRLVVAIGDLRLKLGQARATVLTQHSSREVDEEGKILLAEALNSARELGAMTASLSRRVDDVTGFAELLASPLNKYERAHFEAALANSAALELYWANRAW